jgi:hypothetical protein
MIINVGNTMPLKNTSKYFEPLRRWYVKNLMQQIEAGVFLEGQLAGCT